MIPEPPVLRLRAADLHWRQIDDEVIALEAAGSRYLAANPSAASLWLALAEGATREELARRLVDDYGIALERALADVDAFVAQLRRENLLAD